MAQGRETQSHQAPDHEAPRRESAGRVAVVVGVDGAGRTHRLAQLAAARAPEVAPIDAAMPEDEVAARLAAARTGGALVVVDDAHRLGPPALRLVAAAARAGVGVVLARRPSIDGPELADVDEAVAAQGAVEVLRPLDAAGVAELAVRLTGVVPAAATVEAVLAASAGMPVVAAALLTGDPPGPTAGLTKGSTAGPAAGLTTGSTAGSTAGLAAALVARVQRRLAGLDPGAVAVAHLLALELDLADAVLADAAEVPVPRLPAVMRTLRDEGLLVPEGERMIPAVAQAVLADLPPAQRRRNHDAVARALLATGAAPVVAAIQLRAARAWTPTAAQVYRAAGDQLRFADPAAALSWYDDAIDAGAEPAGVAAGRAEAAALLGLPVDVEGPGAGLDVGMGLSGGPEVGAGGGAAGRLALVHGAVAAHQGRAARAAATLRAAPPPGPLLAVPALMVTGQRESALAMAREAGPLAVVRLAEAALRIGEPAAAVPLFIEAAEQLEQVPPELVLPDTPHALGALTAVTAGDAASAEYLLGRALAAGVGGPVAVDRHRLLLAWVRLRIGRYDTAVAELRRLAGGDGSGGDGAGVGGAGVDGAGGGAGVDGAGAGLAGRDRLVRAALAAGVARRGGDVARLREAWGGVEQALARGTVDLSTVEIIEELVVAAARIRRQARAAPVLDQLTDLVARLGHPPVWTVAVGWIRLQVAIAVEDVEAAATVAAGLGATLGQVPAVEARARALAGAAGLWAQVLTGTVDPAAMLAGAEELAAAELPWEASRLAGQAAIRTTDPGAARRLLERARDLSSAEVLPASGRGEGGRGEGGRGDAGAAGLSERELEVARLVLDGATYREIGGRLFISPKTVEHHVARIRTKVGATTRAEFVAALRGVLGPASGG